METLLKLIIDYASSKQNYNNAFQTYASEQNNRTCNEASVYKTDRAYIKLQCSCSIILHWHCKVIIDYASSKQNYNMPFQTYAREQNIKTTCVVAPRLTDRKSNYNVAAPLFYIGTAINKTTLPSKQNYNMPF